MAAADAEPMAATWIAEFDRRSIPYQAYGDLFTAAQDARVRSIQMTGQAPDLTIEMLIAAWPEVKARQREAEITAGRVLPETAASDCPRCFGSNVEIVYNPSGVKLGARPGCKHRPLEPGEWLYRRQYEQEKRAA
ncbi:MAG TPA: hypothetical protein PKD24_05705 [Pyrinomonadaceae bacterium]|nr:hypothetical protein [Pyrinomonadaceae bacterium]HMP65046.1 hypothetical protein [Pyrinomonadaceae bacterium]